MGYSVQSAAAADGSDVYGELSLMKQTLLFLGILAFCLTSTGCSETSQQWYKPGGTVAMYERDKSACENAILEGPTSGAQSDNYSWEGCMENKGWIVLDKPAM